METGSTPTPAQDKQVTVDVPEDRVAEFYAFYARFLAGSRRRRGPHRHHGRCGGPEHRCGHHHAEEPEAGEA